MTRERALRRSRIFRISTTSSARATESPAKPFWSVTLYDADTRSFIQNKEQRSDRSSRHDPVKNADCLVDLYFAPTAPTGFEKNWIPTAPGKAWFASFPILRAAASLL